MPAPYSYVTIACPDTGQPITVAKNVSEDPLAALYTTNQISQHQREAAERYRHDHEALAGHLRAPSRGPADISGWRGRRADNGQRKPGERINRVRNKLGAAQCALVQRVLIDGQPLPKNKVRDLSIALDRMAEVYGLATPTRH